VANFIGVANLMEGRLLGLDGSLCHVEIPLGQGHAPLALLAAGAEDDVLRLRFDG
jgi:hypothetical protein